jgi:hypothetical protein
VRLPAIHLLVRPALPRGWAALERIVEAPQAPIRRSRRSPEILKVQLHELVGQPLDRSVAHRAVHASLMALAVGRWGRHGAKTITIDRLQRAVAEVEQILAAKQGVDPSYRASFERLALQVRRALGHTGPIGLFGPTSIYGPIDDHAMSPSQIISRLAKHQRALEVFGILSPLSLLAKETRATHGANVDLLKATGEHHYELLPGNLLAFVGPTSALYWMLGAAGHNGPLDLSRTVEGGAWKDRFGKEVTKVTRRGLGGAIEETPLFEMYGESTRTSSDAFFGVEGSAPRGSADAYRFDNGVAQWVTVGASQIEPGERFEISLYRIDGGREEIVDRSSGICGPAGIHAELEPGRYEVRIRQLEPDPSKPELHDPIGRHLGPALMHLRRRGSDAPEDHRDRYRLFVSGGPGDPALYGPPEGAVAQAALVASALQEQVLVQSVLAMEGALATLDLLTPMRILVPPDDAPMSDQDPWIDRYMRAASRLGHAFFRPPY